MGEASLTLPVMLKYTSKRHSIEAVAHCTELADQLRMEIVIFYSTQSYSHDSHRRKTWFSEFPSFVIGVWS